MTPKAPKDSPKEPSKAPAKPASKEATGTGQEFKAKTLPNRIKGAYGTMYYVKDMDAAVKFFQEALGTKPAMASPDWTEFRFGGHALCLHKSEGKDGEHANGSLILHVDNIKEMVADLQGQGIPVKEPHEVHPGAWAAEFKDRDGNVVGLYEGPKGA